MKRGFSRIIPALVLAVLLSAGCGNGSSHPVEVSGEYAAKSYSPEAPMEAAMTEEAASGMNGTDPVAPSEDRKLIHTMVMDVETQDFGGFTQAVEEELSARGGYVQESSRNGGQPGPGGIPGLRQAYYQLRIPEEELESFAGFVEREGNVISCSSSVQDVTLNYVDMEARRTALEEERDQLLQLMDEASSVEELISIRQALSNVNYELESIESRLRTMDNQIDYSTLNLHVYEVEVLKPTEPESAGERIQKGFQENLTETLEDVQEFGIFIATHFPSILWFLFRLFLFVLLIYLFVRIILRICLGSKKKRAARQAAAYTGAGGAWNPGPGGAPAAPGYGAAPHSSAPGAVWEKNGKGGAPELPGSGGAAEKPQTGGAVEKPQTGGTVEKPQTGGAVEMPQTGGAVEKPQTGGAAEKTGPGAVWESTGNSGTPEMSGPGGNSEESAK